MTNSEQCIVGIGEVLWDLLPNGKQLGGAPSNFAYHAGLLGNRNIVVSRIGEDELGVEIEDLFQDLFLSVEGLQIDPVHPTGTVDVDIDSLGQPSYMIVENVAWDHLEWTESLQQIALAADAVCFGSLAQRSRDSRETIQQFIHCTPPETIRLFDVNIRQHYCGREVLQTSLDLANVVKLNDEELDRIVRLLRISDTGDQDAARSLLQAYDLDLLCVTRGSRGSWILSPEEIDIHPGIDVDVTDTVGAGDAFTAALCHHYLKGSSLQRINEAANEIGAWVASQPGATPPADDYVLSQVL